MFELKELVIRSRPYFFSARDLNQSRRALVTALETQRQQAYPRQTAAPRPSPYPFSDTTLDFRANVSNHLARTFYEKRGVTKMADAFEVSRPKAGAQLMQTKHCIRYGMGLCQGPGKPGKDSATAAPLYLENDKGRFEVVFNCNDCGMDIHMPE